MNAHQSRAGAGFNRRPFQVTRGGMLINGRLYLGVVIDKALTETQLEEATAATNDRFERVLFFAEELSALNAIKYQAVIDSFVERIVLPACQA
ncbi:hypothetical protein [Methylibium petroleiphilum]|uniref:Uncharacterized protein n=1 Tax=Methylibium petroleiphilum (strain ATCC BAA-1232 / LMG 22953 / PM1) TaxID=420662 RepID=A2SN60_METPP|nr:hypothetical protein [Methylibium petroleiphilum]ABM96999.1 hypothetical protein Mpe_B0224 [Methylibium petroleiphilum PM1]